MDNNLEHRPAYQTAEKRDCVFALLFAFLCVWAVDCYFWGGAGLGAALCTFGLGLCAAIYLGKYRKKISAYGIFCYAAYLAGALSLAVTDTGKFTMVLLLMLLAAVAFLEFMDIRRHTAGDFRSIGDVCSMLFVLTFGKIANTFYALFHKKGPEGTPQNRKIGGVFLGLIIALPVLGIIVPLLISSDAAFSGMIDRLGTAYFAEIMGALILGLCLFVLIFGRLLALQVHVPRPVEPSRAKGVEPNVIISFLSAVSAVYLLYLFSQLSYFFGAFSGFLPKNFSVAEYARRGFFEMALICAINLVIIFLSTLLCRREKKGLPLAVKLLALFLCLFSLVLAATSLSKLILYVNRFGMTWLRIHTSLFVIFLAVVFLAVIARLFWSRVPYIKIAMAAGTVLLLASAFANPDRLIARHNVEGYLAGEYSAIDMDTISLLNSDGAVPYLLKLIDCPDAEVSTEAKRQLTQRAEETFVIDQSTIVSSKSDWRSWNLCSQEGEKLLRDNFRSYYSEEYYR